MLRRLVIALVLAAGALVLAPPAALADAPAVGQCHQLSPAVTFSISDPTAAVPCGGPHNTLTFAVETSPVPLNGLPDDALAQVLSQACYPSYWQALGGSPSRQRLSDFVLIDFAPTAEERAAGANWIRCDVGLANGRTLAALPALGTPLMPAALPRSMQRCMTFRHLLVPCSRPHALHARKAFQLRGRLGSGAAIFAQAKRHCRGVVWVTWAPAEAWSLGDHWATCFVRSRR